MLPSLVLLLLLSGTVSAAGDHAADEQAIREQRYDDAIKSLKASLRADPDDARGQLLLGIAYAREGEPAKAIPALERAVALQSQPAYVLRLASARLAAGQADAALADLVGLRASDLAGSDVDLLGRVLAVASNRAENSALALEVLVAAQPDLPKAVELRQEIGRLQWAAGRFDLAARAFREAFDLNDDRDTGANAVNAAFLAAKAESDGGRRAAWYREAAEISDRLVASHSEARNLLLAAWAWLALGDDAKASERIDRAAAIEPTGAEAHYLRGLIARKNGRHQEALESFEAALGARPAGDLERRIQRALGESYMRYGRYKDAEAAYQAAGESADAGWAHRSAIEAEEAGLPDGYLCVLRKPEVEAEPED